MELPTSIRLTCCTSGKEEIAAIETLNREVAKLRIDSEWWSNLGNTIRNPRSEPDSEWRWRQIVSTYQNKPNYLAKCIKTTDGLIQAAVVYRVDAMSAIEPAQRAVFVEWLASAPKNREILMKTPRYRGAGTGLLLFAIAQSYFLGFSGRVNLNAVANIEYYLGQGFIQTNIGDDDNVVFEIPASTAIRRLKERGLIDG